MFRKSRSVLIVNADQTVARKIVHAVKDNGHCALVARDRAHALAILEFRAFDVLLVDFDSVNAAGMDFISRTQSAVPRPRIVVVADSGTSQHDRAVLNKGADLLLPKPLDFEKFLSFLAASHNRSSFTGFVDEVDLLEYVQFVTLGRRRTVLEITSSLGTQGRLYLTDGVILHAVCGILEGESALYSCLCFREGTFSHLPWQEPEQATINKSGEFLLMQAAQKRDEAWCETCEIPDNLAH